MDKLVLGDLTIKGTIGSSGKKKEFLSQNIRNVALHN